MHEIISRLEIIREDLGLTQAEFSILGDSKRTTYNTWVNENKPVPSNFIYNIKQRRPREIDLEWLFTGRSRSVVNEPQILYNNTDCEEKLRMANRLIETQQIALDALKSKVSVRVTKTHKPKLHTS